MLKLISSLFVLVVSVTLNAQTVKPIYVVHVNLGNVQLTNEVVAEFLRPNPAFQNRPVVVLRPNLDIEDNPFAVSKWGRQTGMTRPGSEIAFKNTPILTEKMVAWFDELEKKDIRPEVFIMNGHHIVGMGFESDDLWETKFKNQFGELISLSKRSLYFPSVVRSKNYFPVVERFFNNIKLVFIGGCEGLANLEPKENGVSGRALTPEEIKAKYFGGQKDLMLGDISKGQGLAGYKSDLVRIYSSAFTINQSEEVCLDSANGLNCDVFNVNRILPDSGLWDGLHTFNMPYQMKRTFPNAYGVFGFATPSPRTPGLLWKAAFADARLKLGRENFFQPLLSENVSTNEKKQIIQRMRIGWTKATQEGNKRIRNGKIVNRISGSITPAFPELDKNGIFAYEGRGTDFPEGPSFAPYEIREGQESSVTTSAHAATKKEDADVISPIAPAKSKVPMVVATPAVAKKTEKSVFVKAKPVKTEEKVEYAPTQEEDPLFHFIKKLDDKKED